MAFLVIFLLVSPWATNCCLNVAHWLLSKSRNPKGHSSLGSHGCREGLCMFDIVILTLADVLATASLKRISL